MTVSEKDVDVTDAQIVTSNMTDGKQSRIMKICAQLKILIGETSLFNEVKTSLRIIY